MTFALHEMICAGNTWTLLVSRAFYESHLIIVDFPHRYGPPTTEVNVHYTGQRRFIAEHGYREQRISLPAFNDV